MSSMSDLPPDIRAHISKLIQDSTKETFQNLFGINVSSDEVATADIEADNVLCCRADLHQEGLFASMLFSYDKTLLVNLIRDVYPPDMLESEETIDDAGLEIANIVGNYVKAYLNENGYELKMEIPYKFDVYSPAEDNAIHLHFAMQKNGLYIDFVVGDNPPGAVGA